MPPSELPSFSSLHAAYRRPRWFARWVADMRDIGPLIRINQRSGVSSQEEIEWLKAAVAYKPKDCRNQVQMRSKG